MNNNNLYKEKYLKYKFKYLELKELSGGVPPPDKPICEASEELQVSHKCVKLPQSRHTPTTSLEPTSTSKIIKNKIEKIKKVDGYKRVFFDQLEENGVYILKEVGLENKYVSYARRTFVLLSIYNLNAFNEFNIFIIKITKIDRIKNIVEFQELNKEKYFCNTPPVVELYPSVSAITITTDTSKFIEKMEFIGMRSKMDKLGYDANEAFNLYNRFQFIKLDDTNKDSIKAKYMYSNLGKIECNKNEFGLSKTSIF